jgi:hypothetical protein
MIYSILSHDDDGVCFVWHRTLLSGSWSSNHSLLIWSTQLEWSQAVNKSWPILSASRYPAPRPSSKTTLAFNRGNFATAVTNVGPPGVQWAKRAVSPKNVTTLLALHLRIKSNNSNNYNQNNNKVNSQSRLGLHSVVVVVWVAYMCQESRELCDDLPRAFGRLPKLWL